MSYIYSSMFETLDTAKFKHYYLNLLHSVHPCKSITALFFKRFVLTQRFSRLDVCWSFTLLIQHNFPVLPSHVNWLRKQWENLPASGIPAACYTVVLDSLRSHPRLQRQIHFTFQRNFQGIAHKVILQDNIRYQGCRIHLNSPMGLYYGKSWYVPHSLLYTASHALIY